MPRPPNQKTIATPLTLEEKTALTEAAQDEGLALPDFLRTTALTAARESAGGKLQTLPEGYRRPYSFNIRRDHHAIIEPVAKAANLTVGEFVAIVGLHRAAKLTKARGSLPSAVNHAA